ncbi:hypothetical protein F2Q69_00038296 [Brassica cretica]|uniref:Uncharacterized protein n=1 Tax=Brassica cretica TaxID=69181 RepID=A0A8S9SUU0_BRACR|nr:hypothetical protein F2Q69_00038296 [Brassica cretica]
MEGTAGKSMLPQVREKGGSNLEAGYLQLPASQRIANHSKNHKHGLTNQPDIDIHQRHEAMRLSGDAVVRFKTRRLSPSSPLLGHSTLELSQGEKLGEGERHNDGTSNFEASKPLVTRQWPKQHHTLPPEQPQSRRETRPFKDSTCFPRRPPEETKTERVIGVASNPYLRLRGLPDEPRAAKPRNLTRSKKDLLDKVAGAKLSKRRPCGNRNSHRRVLLIGGKPS